jgi:pimeloyl-ACP methyl ester carboxylesterase
MNAAQDTPLERVAGVGIELLRKGRGRPVLFLHPHIGLHGAGGFIERLAAEAEVLAPAHPGFGSSELPAHLTTVDDLAYYYLDFIEALDLRDVVLVGSSLGAWIAQAMAIKDVSRIGALVLLGAVGAKFGTRDKSDIVDIFSTARAELEALCYHDAGFSRRDTSTLSDRELEQMAREWETTARFAWMPYMHDPKLRGRLHRVRIPTLVLWGAEDRIAPPAWGRRYAEAIAGARFEEIAGAGHFPHVEQPAAVVARILGFLRSSRAAPRASRTSEPS